MNQVAGFNREFHLDIAGKKIVEANAFIQQTKQLGFMFYLVAHQ